MEFPILSSNCLIQTSLGQVSYRLAMVVFFQGQGCGLTRTGGIGPVMTLKGPVELGKTGNLFREEYFKCRV